MKILSAAEMREVDRRTIELGIPGLILMENAGSRVVEYLAHRFGPLRDQRIVVFCGKGNNGGDGFVVARQLLTRFSPRGLHVLLAAQPEDLKGDAAANHRMFVAAGGRVDHEITSAMRPASLIVDALLGTGIKGVADGRYAELIREINTGFPTATVVAVDIPSGMPSDAARTEGECVRANGTVTFTALKIAQVLWPNYERCGELQVADIGSPKRLFESIPLNLSEPSDFASLFEPRSRDSNKGMYGHVLVVAGGRGKTGAAAMAGTAALRAGAGLVTVASAESAIPVIAAHAPELMTEPLEESGEGVITSQNYSAIKKASEKKSVLAIGPGLGTNRLTVELVRRLFAQMELPMVVDADALNALAGSDFRGPGALRVLTPHPGEMARLSDSSTGGVQHDRIGSARKLAAERNVVLVLKGERTVIAFPDGRTWINPTGSPALATGGTGDILTGLIAGLMAQFPDNCELAVRAAVWAHGRAGEMGAAELGEKPFLATDILRYLPGAMRACARV
jgi:ADP-dependent NAD(P)H-hydrate dehydratase / NAD(P)H-hydrate epimerase